jgi:hypothetical protein
LGNANTIEPGRRQCPDSKSTEDVGGYLEKAKLLAKQHKGYLEELVENFVIHQVDRPLFGAHWRGVLVSRGRCHTIRSQIFQEADGRGVRATCPLRALWAAVLLCGLSGSRSVGADTRDTVATSARYRPRLASAPAIHFEPVCGGDVE